MLTAFASTLEAPALTASGDDHLSNVYAELDVHSRPQLVAVLGRPT